MKLKWTILVFGIFVITACNNFHDKKAPIQRSLLKTPSPSFEVLVDKSNGGKCSTDNAELLKSKDKEVKAATLPAGSYKYISSSYFYSMNESNGAAQVIVSDKEAPGVAKVDCRTNLEKVGSQFFNSYNSLGEIYSDFEVSKDHKLTVKQSHFFVVQSKDNQVVASTGVQDLFEKEQLVDLSTWNKVPTASGALQRSFTQNEDSTVELRSQVRFKSLDPTPVMVVKILVATYSFKPADKKDDGDLKDDEKNPDKKAKKASEK